MAARRGKAAPKINKSVQAQNNNFAASSAKQGTTSRKRAATSKQARDS